MEFESDEILWGHEEYAVPENYVSNNYRYNDPGDSRSGGWYDTHAAPVDKHEPYQDYKSSFHWGRGYRPAGPSVKLRHSKENDTVNFLTRCGVVQDYLKGLPKVILKLMEPESCGVCAQGFDNFDCARLHYTSRNHIKNVKKWLTQQAKVGSLAPKEIRCSPREQYCELCDIQLLSKIQADAHYAGRQHRAIVEGHRVPKNPFLLQNNMRERVEKLIRRERSCLKTISAAKTIATEPPKPIPPELFCKTCQISVTNTEQMMMHLNGKKHLAKERKLILEKLKGGTFGTTTDADHGASAQGKRETNETDFDWGQGSGTWDDDPQ